MTVRSSLGALARATCVALAALCLVACSLPIQVSSLPVGRPVVGVPEPPSALGFGSPEEEGIDGRELARMTRSILESDAPIYSVLISRHDKLVFELYTSWIARDDAHYLMSATKSVMSTLVGIASDRHFLPAPDASIVDALPPALMGTPSNAARLRRVTIKDVLGMSALDAPVAPHQKTAEARERLRAFMRSDNRARFALGQPLLRSPGEDYLYTDVTPALAAGMVAYAAHESVLDFADQNLFGPLGFRNVEWMHQDGAGLDNGAFGLRLRPIDMQKLGLLFLHHGEWGGRQILSRAWVDRSFTPWIASKPGLGEPDYGWYWWRDAYGPGWTAHLARGWKGQVIAVFPEQDLVVTMTACFEDGSERRVFRDLVTRFVRPAVESKGGVPRAEDAAVSDELRRLLSRVRETLRIRSDTEPRMIPGTASKQTRRAFDERG